jgi:hypothetical protein
MQKESFVLYDGQVTLEYNDKTHRYYVLTDGKRISVPSVTTVCGVVNKPMLVQWAANQAVNLMQGAIGPGVEYDEFYLTGVYSAARNAHNAIRDDAAALGTLVHNILDLRGPDQVLPTGGDPRVASGVGAGNAWLHEHNVETIHAELPIYSRQHHYSGRLDRICRVDGRLALVDWKTSNGIWPEYFMQIAAYRHAYEEQTGEKIERCHLVHLGKESGEFKAITVGRTKSAKDFATFLACRHIYESLKDLNKRTK